MNVHELIAEVERYVPEGAPFGTRHRAQATIATSEGSHTVAVAARIDRDGRRREQCFCDGTRMPRHVLLRLTCAQSRCPQARAVREQWHRFHHRDEPEAPPRKEGPPQARPLLEEFDVAVAGHACIARSGRFSSFVRCPNLAHPPMRFDETGFDLFEDGVCVGGGVVANDGMRRPRLPSLEAARAYLLARRLEMMAILNAVMARRGG